MAGKRKKKHASLDDLPLTSFSDIAFLLIIFFIVVSSLMQFSGFVTNLPSSEKSEEESEEPTHTVQLHDGEITYNQDRVASVQDLVKRLKKQKFAEKKDVNDRIVLFDATGKVVWQQYYPLMAAIHQAGGYPVIVQSSGEEEAPGGGADQ